MKAMNDMKSDGGNNGEGRLRKVRKVRSKQDSNKCRNRMGRGETQEAEESVEVKAYLDKLQEMVPCMPKDKKLSKLDVITHAIDYIRDLRDTLGLPQCDSEDFDDFDMNFPLDSFTSEDTIIPVENVSVSPALLSNNGYNIDTRLSVSVSTSSPAPSPNENFMKGQDEGFHHHILMSNNNNNSSRQPFCAIANLNGSLSEASNAALEESLKLKQISCRL